MNPRVRNISARSRSAQLVTQPPGHHECDDIARILHTVEHTDAALVELLAAVPTPEPAIATPQGPGAPSGSHLLDRTAALGCVPYEAGPVMGDSGRARRTALRF